MHILSISKIMIRNEIRVAKRVEVRPSLRQFRRDLGNTSVEGERNDQAGQIVWSASIALRTRPRVSRRTNRRTSFERSWDQLTARKRAGLYSFDETIMIACERTAPLHLTPSRPRRRSFHREQRTDDLSKDVWVTWPNWVVERPSGRAEERTARSPGFNPSSDCRDFGPDAGNGRSILRIMRGK